jgi:acyl-CoA synthetase (AMP-forming)/AMP-acid ligase II
MPTGGADAIGNRVNHRRVDAGPVGSPGRGASYSLSTHGGAGQANQTTGRLTTACLDSRRRRSLAAVAGIPDETKGELAKAYVILKPAMETTPEDLVAHCRQHLAAYKVPRASQFTNEVPMTSSGKIMRRLLTDIDDGTRTTTSDLHPAAS